MRSHLFLLGIISLCTFSCRQENKIKIVNGEVLTINLDNNKNSNSLDSIVTDLQCIKLETPKNVRLSELTKVIAYDNKLYAFDKKFSAIEVYNSEGKHLFQLGGLGLQDDKFLRVEDVTFNEAHKTLWVLCNNPRKIIEFSLEGKFIKKIDLNFFASNVGFISPNLACFHVNQNGMSVSEGKNLLITDTSNNVIQRFFDWPKGVSSMIEFTGGIIQTNNKVFYNPPFEPVYYQITDSTLTERYKFNFGKEKVSKSIFDRSRLGTSLVETADYIGFNYFKDSCITTAFFNKKLNKLFLSDVDKSPLNFLFNSTVVSQDKDTLLLATNPFYLQALLKKNEAIIKNKFPHVYDKLVDSKISETDLFVLKLTLKHY